MRWGVAGPFSECLAETRGVREADSFGDLIDRQMGVLEEFRRHTEAEIVENGLIRESVTREMSMKGSQGKAKVLSNFLGRWKSLRPAEAS